jgi:hypothetical protein
MAQRKEIVRKLESAGDREVFDVATTLAEDDVRLKVTVQWKDALGDGDAPLKQFHVDAGENGVHMFESAKDVVEAMDVNESTTIVSETDRLKLNERKVEQEFIIRLDILEARDIKGMDKSGVSDPVVEVRHIPPPPHQSPLLLVVSHTQTPPLSQPNLSGARVWSSAVYGSEAKGHEPGV